MTTPTDYVYILKLVLCCFPEYLRECLNQPSSVHLCCHRGKSTRFSIPIQRPILLFMNLKVLLNRLFCTWHTQFRENASWSILGNFRVEIWFMIRMFIENYNLLTGIRWWSAKWRRLEIMIYRAIEQNTVDGLNNALTVNQMHVETNKKHRVKCYSTDTWIRQKIWAVETTQV